MEYLVLVLLCSIMFPFWYYNHIAGGERVGLLALIDLLAI